jgi:uncharacterized protein YdeI (YjbR/CyaY-like superfamily)
MEQYDARVDAYIEKSAVFAKPILNHVRQIVHAASPLITENIKWGMPFFEYKGPVCMMAAFKQHCGFGFWKSSRLNDPKHLLTPGEEASAGSFGRIESIGDLPGDDDLKGFVLQLMKLNESGIKEPAIKKAPVEKKELVTPPEFEAILSQNPKAKDTFGNFSYSHKKEYLEWITEAKTEATRQKRMAQAIEMIEEGKSKNWKYR